MSAEGQYAELHTGAGMPFADLTGAAREVSEWLTQAPCSINKSLGDILAYVVAGEANFLSRGEQQLGFFALVNFEDPAYAALDDEEMPLLWSMPHYGIRSLIVDPQEQGNGFGRLLIGEACMVAGGRTLVNAPGERLSLVSAIATESSMIAFAKAGFTLNGSSKVAEAHGYTLDDLERSGKALVSKVVRIGRPQPALADKLST